MRTIDDANLQIKQLEKEVRTLKRKLALSETNLSRARLVSSTQNRIERLLDESLKKELRFFKLVLDNTTSILLLLDFDGRFAYASRTFLENAGISGFGFINGMHYHDVLKTIISEGNLQNFTEAIERAVSQKMTVTLEDQIDFNFKGTTRTFSILITPMTDESDNNTGIMALFNDITAINNALEAANKASHAKSNFLANMSHEIRTPLNAIIGMGTIAQSSKDVDKIHYCLDKISDSSNHLLGVINDILDMSKIETNHFELSFTEFVFEKLIQRIVDMMRFKTEEKGIDFEVKCDAGIPKIIYSDEQRLAQVIMNLLSNAVKFTPENGKVAIHAEALNYDGENHTIRISVSDSGIGISEKQRPRLFKVFSQADGSISRKFGGTGLGLVISKRIVNMLDGDIWFDSEEGKGTTFYFTIKTRDCKIDEWSSGESEECIKDNLVFEKPIDYSGKKVLLVDDVEINREIILALLENTGLTMVGAENGREAVDIFTASPEEFDLIFMDLQMPEVDGYEATRLIRSLSAGKAGEIPIVAMTANVFKDDIERCLDSGMNDHIGKPIDADELMMKLKKWLQ